MYTLIKRLCLNKSTNLLFHQSKLIISRQFQHETTFRTALYGLHVKYGGKMVVFADHWLPLQYKNQSLIESHVHVRNEAGLFDVSHMLQSKFTGKHCAELLESLSVADCKQMKKGTGSLSVLTNTNGGIIDDLIISRVSDNEFYVVSNAGCADKVRPLFEQQVKQFQQSGNDVSVEFLNANQSLIALQGPKAQDALQPLVTEDLKQMYFMQSKQVNIQQVPVRITRCGYTGEDGFEISVPNDFVCDLVERLIHKSNNNVNVQLAGLGARDSLRLEAGLCLYGNDIDENTTPVEAGLMWTIGKQRRQPETGTFPGADKILQQVNKQLPVQRKRIGLKGIANGPPARQGATILGNNQQVIGHVTSGCPSPILKENIAIAYVDSNSVKIGTQLNVQIRNRSYQYEVVKMPFVPTHYYLPPKN